jgi:radical SAM superfamily enzyme YgiQ (UPF0313 family)
MSENKRVLLVSLRSPFLDSDRIYLPMGLLYIASFLKSAGHHVDIENAFGEEGEQRVKDYSSYDVIGVSIMTPQKQQASELLNYLKTELKPQKQQIVVAGGPHAKFYTSELEKEPWDYIITGDGEKSFLEIIEGRANQRILFDRVKNGEEYDSMPRPDRLGFADLVKSYTHTFGKDKRKATTFLSGRGCPMQCTFCENAHTPIRKTSLEKAKKEFDDIEALGFNGIYIIDDSFTLSIDSVKPYVEELKKRGIAYKCNGHAKFMNEEFADLLANTGCVEIGFGAESGSQKILDNVKKQTTIEQNYNFVRLMKERGIRVRAFFVIGLPGETKETIKETEKFIKESGIDDFQITIYSPFKGTEIRDELDKGNPYLDLFMEREAFAYVYKGGKTESNVRTRELSSNELLKERNRLVTRYKPASHTVGRDNPLFFNTQLKESPKDYGYEIKDKSILITGGSGALGRALIKRLLEHDPKKIIIFNRDEEKQDKVKKMYGHDKIEYIIGDIKDYYSIRDAVRKVDIVIHAAAFKYVDIAENQVMECLKTNVIGSMNVINAVKDEKNVETCLAISTDKACSPINVYGMSKCLMERLFCEAARTKGDLKTKFLTVRYGNVLMTTGSVIPKWKKKCELKEEIEVTDPNMTRFLFTLDESINLIFYALHEGNEEEIISTRMDAALIGDLASVMSKGKIPVRTIGERPGEKKNESLIADFECKDTIEKDGKFIIKLHSNQGINSPPYDPFTSGVTKRMKVEEIEEILRRVGGID